MGIPGVITEALIKQHMMTFQLKSVSHNCRISKCSSSPTEELSYSASAMLSVEVLENRAGTPTLPVHHVRALFRCEEHRGVGEVHKYCSCH